MPWNNQTGGGRGGGPWGGGGGGSGGPWGNGSGGGGVQPPDLEDLIRRSQDRLRNVLPGGGGGGAAGASKALIALIVLIGVVFGSYAFLTFRVQPDQLGVVLRFGAFSRIANPGLNFRLPYPLEQVFTPSVTTINRVDVGARSDGGRGAIRDVPEESLMLTGDENIVDVDFAVFWRISDARLYLFNIDNPEGSVKAVAESVMREVVGRSEIQPILTQGRQIAETAVQELMQQALDEYGAGIEITQVQLLKVDPPSQVIDAFRDVQAARADSERAQNEAQAYANRIIPEARGETARILEAANAYREQTVAEARGQADRFTAVLEQYLLAPQVTRERLYLETIEDILGSTQTIIIDQQPGGQGVVPFLPLDQLQGRQTPGATR
ncbi:MAG: FtsH protease activity modulator HflK [Hyphomicrobiaceae bacterium]|nr:FtsH protease activity modulator HflK [Hyphomicrobiaceae bacterium]